MHSSFHPINNWNSTQKWLFRFFAAYFFLNIFPFPVGWIPLTDTLETWFTGIWNVLVPWAGQQLLNIDDPINTIPNGSGDTTYAYVCQFLFVIIAAMTTIIWSAIDRKRNHYYLHLYWIMVYVRYYLAFTLLSYGFYKIIKTQFPFPFYNLTQTYGESSPMGLLWNFMGYSTAYNMFTGLAEALAGFFLLFRRTTTFGALFAITVLSNVVAMNFCYDVPVKLYSTTLLFMAIFIVIPDIYRLIDFFFRSKALAPPRRLPQFHKPWMKLTRYLLKVLLITTVLYMSITDIWEGYKMYGDEATLKNPMFGIYNVRKFVKNEVTLLPLATDSLQWKQLNIVYANHATVKIMNDSVTAYSFELDSIKKTISFSAYNDTFDTARLHYSYPDSTHLLLTGILRADSVSIEMQKFDLNKMRLINRGFHWINEYPYNR